MKKLIIIMLLLFSTATLFGQERFVRSYNYTIVFTPEGQELSSWQDIQFEFYSVSGDMTITKGGEKRYFNQTSQVFTGKLDTGIGYQIVEFKEVNTGEAIECVLYDTGEIGFLTDNGNILFKNL